MHLFLARPLGNDPAELVLIWYFLMDSGSSAWCTLGQHVILSHILTDTHLICT